MPLLSSTITSSEFSLALNRYDSTITEATRPKPDPLSALDTWRRAELPATIASRSPPHMTKAEVYRLVDCKLKRGKNRPILRLIESNADDFVVATTTTAFAATDIHKSFATLLALKGVGPATASYLLAAHSFPKVPVFSDEAFRWVVHDGNWEVGIKYNEKEYWELYKRVGVIAERLGVEEDDVERVGFVLGQEAVVRKGKGKGKGKGVIKNRAGKVKAPKEKVAEGKKRKAGGGAETTDESMEAKRPQAKKQAAELKSETIVRSRRVLRSRKLYSGT